MLLFCFVFSCKERCAESKVGGILWYINCLILQCRFMFLIKFIHNNDQLLKWYILEFGGHFLNVLYVLTDFFPSFFNSNWKKISIFTVAFYNWKKTKCVPFDPILLYNAIIRAKFASKKNKIVYLDIKNKWLENRCKIYTRFLQIDWTITIMIFYEGK